MGYWGFDVLPQCILCFASALDRENLFFQCVYNGEMWSYFLNRLNFPVLSSFDATLSWLVRPSLDPNMVVILTVVYQLSNLYVFCLEGKKCKNSCLFASYPQSLITEIKDTIRLRLDPSPDQRRLSFFLLLT